jgi:hypothetical protein
MATARNGFISRLHCCSSGPAMRARGFCRRDALPAFWLLCEQVEDGCPQRRLIMRLFGLCHEMTVSLRIASRALEKNCRRSSTRITSVVEPIRNEWPGEPAQIADGQKDGSETGIEMPSGETY